MLKNISNKKIRCAEKGQKDLLEERLIKLQKQGKLEEYCTAVQRMSIIISKSTKCYSLDQEVVRTSQVPYSNKILLAEFDLVSSIIHEVAHESDEKLAWEKMVRFLKKLLTKLLNFEEIDDRLDQSYNANASQPTAGLNILQGKKVPLFNDVLVRIRSDFPKKR